MIYVCIWGYEQTNVDFYQVIKKRGKTQIVLRKIGSDKINDEHGFMSYKATPKIDCFTSSKELRRKLQSDNYVSISDYSCAKPWSGLPVSGSSYA